MFVDYHAAIVIFGGSFAATLIRFPLSSIFHGLPLGAKYRVHAAANVAARAGRRARRSRRDRAQAGAGRAGKVEIDTFIRDNLERDRDNFLTHLDEGQKIYRAIDEAARNRGHTDRAFLHGGRT